MHKILIVDDDENIRELVRATVEDEGFEVFEAPDGNQALAMAREIQPDLIILDVMMPGKIGYHVCVELKQDKSIKTPYVIFLTARGTTIAQMAGKSHGGDEYLTKPFEPEELRQRVRNALKVKQKDPRD